MVSKSLGRAPSHLISILCCITILSFVMLSSTTASADVIDDVVITVPAACTFSNTTTDTTHSASINNNHLESDIGTTNFTVYCNDGAGFAIYAIGYSDDTYGNTDMLGATSNTNIATGLATSGPTSAWAMKLIPTAGTFAPTIESDSNGSYANYHIVPTTYTKVATFNTTTDNTVGSNMQSTYRVFASATQPADTYTGKVRYTLVHPASEVPLQPQPSTARCINYFANASDAVGTMGCQSATDNASVELLASNFSRNGYGFAGWSDAFDYATNINANFYGPNETITAPVGTTANGLSLYAVWVKSEGNLQGWTGCSSLTKADTATNILSESITALSDSRDNNTYAIAKLADGKCWMIENLRLESTNSDNSTGTLAQGYGTSATYGNFSGLADAETADKFSSTYSANSLYSNDGANNTINIGTTNAAYRIPRYSNVNTSARASSPTTNGVAMYSYGNYYTWHAAIADLAPNNTNNNSTTNTSICPAGWHLPQGGRKANVSVSDFWILSRATMGADPANFADDYFYYTGTPEGTEASNKMRSYPLNFVYSGYVNSGSVSGRGSNGGFWSSTASSSIIAYYLFLDSSYVYPGTNYNSKYFGRAVRCVASGV